MTVKELREELSKFPDGIEVILEAPLNEVEFNMAIEEVYESGKLYLHAKGSVISDGDIKRFWGVDIAEK